MSFGSSSIVVERELRFIGDSGMPCVFVEVVRSCVHSVLDKVVECSICVCGMCVKEIVEGVVTVISVESEGRTKLTSLES